MKSPVSHRKGIPFFYKKTETDFKKDVYESFDKMVVRQSALHLTDHLWGKYPMQSVLDFAFNHYPNHAEPNILEIGCGVGKWIATLAQSYPQAICWGMDYSYQMLKRANEFWVLGRDISIDLSNKGFSEYLLKGKELPNLNFGLAKAADLPFEKRSQDLVINSFLLDRLDDPAKALVEMHRVLRGNGRLVVVTPLNFNHKKHWETLYPSKKIYDLLIEIGFNILDWQEELIIEEPLDGRGNMISWKCLAFAASATSPK